MNPFALTAEERAGAMMEPAAPGAGTFMDNIGALRAMVAPQQRYGNGAWLDESTAGTVTVGEGGAGVIRRARSYIAEEPGKTYGAILPLKKDDATGDLSFAIPGFARDSVTGLLDMLEGHMTPEASMALLDIPIGGLLHAGVTGARQTPETLAAIRAYHGSPHRFDKFSLDKIGTGEGAQAYGHGLYFAENEKVAGGYRDALSAGERHVKVLRDGKPFEPRTQAETLARNAVQASRGDAGRLSEWLDETRAMTDGPYAPFSRADVDEAAKIAPRLTADASGALYTARLNVEPDDLLDWDKPLSEQSAKVRAALEKANPVKIREGQAYIGDTLLGPADHGEEINFWNGILRSGAGNAYKQIERAAGKQEAARIFREAGIPGIRYLDQGSRGAGEGTRNFVIFDDSLISIESIE